MNKHLLALCVLVWPAVACALTGQETVVIANSASKESVELAKFYVEARKVPEAQLLLVKTSTAFEVSRADYETQIRTPLLEFLQKDNLADRVRCLVFIWGIPVRIAAGAAATNPADEAIRIAVGRAHYRLAMDYQLMGKAGGNFPASMPADLLPPSKQFNLPAQIVKDPLTPLPELLKDIAELAGSKQIEIRRLSKPEEQTIAHRQMMSLHTDIYGLKGLLAYITDWHPARAPSAEDVQKLVDAAEKRLAEVREGPVTAETAALKAALIERIVGLALVTSLTPQAGDAPQLGVSAVDSDLALVLWSNEDRQGFRLAVPFHAPAQSVPNPMHWRFAASAGKFPKAFLAARLDGPTCDDAKKALTAALDVKKTGLAGRFYIDAGVKGVGTNPPAPYIEFDSHLKHLYALLTAKTSMKAVLDNKEAVFPEGSCPDAALYAGWYSLKSYVAAFKWVPGSVGIHYASFEATELRDPKSAAWCNRMIQEGVSVTVGAVKEPFLHSFVMPDEFFPLLLTGKYTAGECFARTNPLLNWQTILIGDPLYNPLGARPALKVEDLPRGLAP